MRSSKFISAFHTNNSTTIIYAVKVLEKGGRIFCYGFLRSDTPKEDRVWKLVDVSDWYEEKLRGSDKILSIDL